MEVFGRTDGDVGRVVLAVAVYFFENREKLNTPETAREKSARMHLYAETQKVEHLR